HFYRPLVQPHAAATAAAARSGVVVFRSEAARASVLKYAARGQVLQYGGGEAAEEEDAEPAGVKAWVHQHKAARPGNEVLQKQIDEWMESFDAEAERKARERQEAMGGDGWTVVVRAKRMLFFDFFSINPTPSSTFVMS
ncbi:hypothetical protein TSOC_008866, partial [Tetrabaena socialis]